MNFHVNCPILADEADRKGVHHIRVNAEECERCFQDNMEDRKQRDFCVQLQREIEYYGVA